MNFHPEAHALYAVANAPLRTWPFPHIYVDSVLPDDYYARLRAHWPSARFVSLAATGRVPEGAYPERFILPLRPGETAALPEPERTFWEELSGWLLGSSRFFYAIMDKFETTLRERFGDALEDAGFSHEVLVVRDHTNYALGPHTDSPRKVISVLFYCPDDDTRPHLGTSIYEPVDRDFRCPGGPHYPFDRFSKVATMAYRPNSLFAFVKTDRSFHGVDPVRDADVMRNLILYDIQVQSASRDA